MKTFGPHEGEDRGHQREPDAHRPRQVGGWPDPDEDDESRPSGGKTNAAWPDEKPIGASGG